MTLTSHLTETELVELLDDQAGDRARAHASACPSCGARVEVLRHTWALVESDEAAEPSPLFWSHLSSRVAAAIRSEEIDARRWHAWRWVLAAAPALAVVLAIAVLWRPARTGQPIPRAEVTPAPAAAEADVAAAGMLAFSDDADTTWELVATLSDGLAEESSGSPVFEPRLGAADRALAQLSAAEQEELARLLAGEMGGGPS
ncbi:MAG: hypothetical protein AB1806_00680 [Acidobacteriota bacterium]